MWAAGSGASEGGAEMDEGAAAGDSEVDGWGELPVAGDAAGDLADGDTACDGDGAAFLGDGAEDWAMVELNNNAATSIKTKVEPAIF